MWSLGLGLDAMSGPLADTESRSGHGPTPEEDGSAGGLGPRSGGTGRSGMPVPARKREIPNRGTGQGGLGTQTN